MGGKTVGLVLALGWLGWAPGRDARAEEEDRADQAARMYAQGGQSFERREYDQAAERFKQAYDLVADAAYLYNIGLCYERQERWRLAVEYFDRFLHEAPTAAIAPDARDRRDRALGTLGIGFGTVVVQVDLPGASVAVGGRETPPSTELRLPEGSYDVVVTHAQYGRTHQAASVTKDNNTIVQFTLAPAPLDSGGLAVGGWASVGVGGAALVTGILLGSLALQAQEEGLDLVRTGSPAQDGARLRELRETVSTHRVAADVCFAVGAAGVVLGTVLLLVASQEAPQLGSAQEAGWRF